MNRFFNRLPLLAKLLLIGLIPYTFLVILTLQVYNEKTDKLLLFENYKQFIAESANINQLIDALQEERKYSFDYAMTKSMRQELVLQRPRTDALIHRLMEHKDPALAEFTQYTKLKQLAEIRTKVDASQISPNDVMHFYSNTVFRMNTLNTIPPANTPYLKPVYKDLMTQKILSEMITYLGIIRSNIYNVLYTKAYMIETLIGTIGTHDVYKSYEEELFVKARPEIIEKYKTIKDTTAFKPTIAYINTLFATFKFDDSYNAQEWWAVSDKGENELRALQNSIQKKLQSDIQVLYNKEEKSRENTLLFLIFALVSVLFTVAYIVFVINRTLKNLRQVTEKIANGEVGVAIKSESNDVIGQLSTSISKIDQNNMILAEAATAIGHGNFKIKIEPRSKKDVLGIAIADMKAKLHQYSGKMEQLVQRRTQELARSNDDLQQFAHVASHDMKEPLRKIAMFSNILTNEHQEGLTDKAKIYLNKIEHASHRMSAMIEGVLSYSMINMNQPVFEDVSLVDVMEGVENDLELAIIQKEAKIDYDDLPNVSGLPLLLHQLIYNLINNSLKFSRVGVPPRIVIRWKIVEGKSSSNLRNANEGKFIAITISDNGIGINPANAEKMFAIFTRLHAKEKYEGTGLGLALCRKIMDRHEGTISASGEEGVGTEFTLQFPVRTI